MPCIPERFQFAGTDNLAAPKETSSRGVGVCGVAALWRSHAGSGHGQGAGALFHVVPVLFQRCTLRLEQCFTDSSQLELITK